MEIVSILAGIAVVCLFCQGGDGFRTVLCLLDMPSLICILVLTVPILLRSGLGRDFMRAFKLLRKGYTCHLSELRRTLDAVELMQKQVLCAGILCMLISFIYVLHSMNTPESLGPCIAVAVLTLFYAVIMEMLLLPLQIEAKRRIIDYIGEEEKDADCAENVKMAE